MSLSLDKAIGSATVRLSKKISRIINHHLKEFNITTEQWAVLRTVYESGLINQRTLSERADKDKATLTKILDLLEKHEYTTRVQNPDDRRSFLIQITEKGSNLVNSVGPYLKEVYSELIGDIDSEKLRLYQEVLSSLENNIDSLLEIEWNRKKE
ncbi:MarR family winged helix-turn-helix transcriptional regulator [Virgibacillus siamensis]|uniref:MarR family winged helix-turn-helix transcriptional regulator n=1 Tax=Virgibacillus siamensis TaxID=480071 RepID=UPI001FEB9A60|nr:MarR family transcriptional regulator [Virgibacillus siamensis]